MLRLRIDILRVIARECGDCSIAAIARRTRVPESSISRFFNGRTQPDLRSMLRISSAYGVHVEDLIELTEVNA